MACPEGADRLVALDDGTQLHVCEYGDGDPLVLVCGTAQSQFMWAPLLPALACGHRVVTYDHRDMGQSTAGTDTAVTNATLADDLATLLAAMDIPQAHVFGWSLGSTIAQELALRHPQRVRSLVLVSTWGRTDAVQTALFTALGHPWRTGHRDAALTALGLGFSSQMLNSPQFQAMMGQLAPLFPSTPSQMAAAAAQWQADITHDALDRLKDVSAPTLVVSAEHDLLAPPALAQAVAEQIPGARFELLTGPDASHAVLLERPEEFGKLVMDFLGNLGPATGATG